MIGLGNTLSQSSPATFAEAGAKALSGNGYAMVFDGVNDKGSMSDGDNIFDDMATGDWSLSFYVKFDGANTNSKTIFWKGSFLNYLWISTDSTGNLAIMGFNGSWSIRTSFNTSFSTSTWYHVVLTSDSSGTNRDNKGYIDGSLVSVISMDLIPSSVNIESATGTSTFFLSEWLGMFYFANSIDEIATWNSVLTSEEITDINTEKLDLTQDSLNYGSSSNLQRYFRAEAGTGTSVADVSGNSNGAITLESGATFTSNTPF